MVVVAPTMTSGRCNVDNSAVLKRVKEFRSLENDLGCVSQQGKDGVRGVCNKNSKHWRKNDISVSLPNLTSAIILFDQHSLVDVDARVYEGVNSDNFVLEDKNSGRTIESWPHSVDNNSIHFMLEYKNEGVPAYLEHQGGIATNENNGADNIKDVEHSTVSDIHQKEDVLEDRPGISLNSCDETVEHSSTSISVRGESSQNTLEAIENNVPDQCCDGDLEQVDELTRLKDSPRSSPGNTLDSMTSSSSLGRVDSFGKTDASSFSSVSSLSADLPPSVTSNTGAVESIKENEHVLDSNSNTFVDVNLKNQNTFEKSTSSQDSGIDTNSQQQNHIFQKQGAKPKKKGLTLGGFLTR